jgi:hypothetical protein
MSLINKAMVRKAALEMALNKYRLSTGEPRFTRVSAYFLKAVDLSVENEVRGRIERAGRKGRTL